MPKIITVFFAILFAAQLSGCATAGKETQRKEDARLAAILKQNDTYERAFSYQQNCLKIKEPMNKIFLENFKHSANMLFDEYMTSRKWKPQDIVGAVLERRKQLQKFLDDYYMKHGCNSEEVIVASQYYAKFSTSGQSLLK
jgi:hypothetical protein